MTLSKTHEYPSIIGKANSSKPSNIYSNQKSVLVVGLGNIGKEYQNTRHNVGFIAVDYLSEYYKISWNTKSKLHAELAQGIVDGQKLLLAKPVTYMKLSGKAVQAICSYYNINPPNIFVLHDDIDLEIGRIKYKLAGGSGGHNGLKSLDQCIGNDYHRIRIGVGRPSAYDDVSDYVLAPFSKEEYKIIISSIDVITNNFHFISKDFATEQLKKVEKIFEAPINAVKDNKILNAVVNVIKCSCKAVSTIVKSSLNNAIAMGDVAKSVVNLGSAIKEAAMGKGTQASMSK